MLNPDKYYRHNFHNEKINEWLVKEGSGFDYSYSYGIESGQGFGCDCEDDDPDYHFFYDKYDFDEVLEAVPNLTEEEKENVRDIENLRVYVCPVCGIWSVDGDNC